MKKAQIETFDALGNKTAVIENYTSLSFTRGLHSPGDFIITMKLNTSKAKYFVKDGMIRINSDSTKCGKIHTITKKVDASGLGGMTLTVKGKELWSITAQRVINPGVGSTNYEVTAVAETIIKGVIKAQMGSTAQTARQWPGISFGTDLGRGPSYLISAFGTNLQDELSKCAMATGIGVYAYLSSADPALIVFDTIHGLDRRTSQSVNPQALFSSDLGTVRESEFTEISNAEKNLVYVGGQGEVALRNVRTVFDTTEPTGATRREAYKDSRNLDTNTKLDASGASLLDSNAVTLFIDSKILAFSRLKYQTDFDLGDLVTVKEFGLTQDGQIVSVSETWEAGNYEIDVIFDKEKPRLDRQIQGQYNATTQAIGVIPATVESSEITASTVVKRDQYGRAKMTDPSVGTEIATKNYVDAVFPVGVTWEQKPGTMAPSTLWPIFSWLDISARSHSYGVSLTNSGPPTSYKSRIFCGQDYLYANTDLSIGDTFVNGSTTYYVRELVTFSGKFSRIVGGNAASFESGDQDFMTQGHRHRPSTQVNQGQTYSPIAGSVFVNTVSGGADNFPDTGDPITDGTNGTPKTGSETRPANFSIVLWIRTA